MRASNVINARLFTTVGVHTMVTIWVFTLCTVLCFCRRVAREKTASIFRANESVYVDAEVMWWKKMRGLYSRIWGNMSLLYCDWPNKLKFNSVRDSTDILHSNTLHILKRNGNEWRNVTTIIHQASGICKLCSPWWDPGDLWNVTHVTGWDTIWGNTRKGRQKSRLRHAQYTTNIRS